MQRVYQCQVLSVKLDKICLFFRFRRFVLDHQDAQLVEQVERYGHYGQCEGIARRRNDSRHDDDEHHRMTPILAQQALVMTMSTTA